MIVEKYLRDEIEKAMTNALSISMEADPDSVSVEDNVTFFMDQVCQYQGVKNNKWVKLFIDKTNLDQALDQFTSIKEQSIFYNELGVYFPDKYSHLMMTKSNMKKLYFLSKELNKTPDDIINKELYEWYKKKNDYENLMGFPFGDEVDVSGGMFYLDLNLLSLIEDYIFPGNYYTPPTMTDLLCVVELIIHDIFTKM